MSKITVDGHEYEIATFGDKSEVSIEITDSNGDFFAECIVDHNTESAYVDYEEEESANFPYFEYTNPVAFATWAIATYC